MRSGVLFIGLYFLCSTLAAQDDISISVSPAKDSIPIRDRNIQRYPNHFFLWPVLKQRSLSFELENLKGSKETLTFKPNNAFTFGLGVYLFELGIEFTFALPVDDKSKKKFGESHAKDFQINALSKRFAFDLYNQKYSGFYMNDSETKIPRPDPFPQRADITTRNFGLSGFYILNDKKFSIKSAYNFAERQLKSHGSMLIVGALNSFKLQADSSVIPVGYRASFGEGSSFEVLKYTTFSIAPGYSYSLVYRQFFLNGTFVLGPAHNWIYYKMEDGKEKNDITINTYSSVRIALGYNSDHFFAGINFVTQARSVRFENIRAANTSSTFRLLLGYRFHEFGILKKSVWDIPRALFK
jgi:hypothetical protein